MLLLFFTVSGVYFGSSDGKQTEEVCYGRSWNFPSNFVPPLYRGPVDFTPSNGGSTKVVINGGKATDPRFRVSPGSIYLTDVTERDEGIYSASFGGNQILDVVKLKVLECAENITKYYKHLWDYPIPARGEFLEFTPLHSLDQPEILWNRTDPQIRQDRVQVKNNVWEFSYLTQGDNGYYNFRDKDNSVLARILLKVQELTEHYDAKEKQRLLVGYPPSIKMWTVIFTPEGEIEPKTVMNGSLIIKDNWFFGRIQAVTNGIEVDPVERSDSGTFEFRDPEGNLALTAQVEVDQGFKSQIILTGVIALVSFMGIVCCWCCKNHKSAPQTAAAPAVYYHNESQPTGPSYSDEPPPPYSSYQPVNSLVSKQPTSTSSEPPAYHKVSIHVNPSQHEVALPAPSVGSDFLSSDPEPRLELKGLTVPSAPPLSSDSTYSDVYHSEKLNFL